MAVSILRPHPVALLIVIQKTWRLVLIRLEDIIMLLEQPVQLIIQTLKQ